VPQTNCRSRNHFHHGMKVMLIRVSLSTNPIFPK
jgi:hypothetical protein